MRAVERLFREYILPNLVLFNETCLLTGDALETARSIAAHLLAKEPLDEIKLSDIKRWWCKNLDNQELRAAMEILVVNSWAYPDRDFHPTCYTINPAIWTKFPERMNRERNLLRERKRLMDQGFRLRSDLKKQLH